LVALISASQSKGKLTGATSASNLSSPSLDYREMAGFGAFRQSPSKVAIRNLREVLSYVKN
jgi:hypothetical protein